MLKTLGGKLVNNIGLKLLALTIYFFFLFIELIPDTTHLFLFDNIAIPFLWEDNDLN